MAEVLPLPHRTVRPYTLGEAVAELGDYVQTGDVSTWNSRSSTSHRASLRTEIKAQSEAVGGRLGTLVAPLLHDLRLDGNQEAIIATADQFNEIWHSEVAIAEAFWDLCAAAKVPGKTSDTLRKLSAIVASQVGPAAHGAFSLLSYAADALVNTEEQLAWERDVQILEPLTEEHRLEMAREILVAPPVGRVVVWTVYSRALLSGMRKVIGPMTFLRADWALPNAFEHKWHDFPERAELRELREDVHWLDDLHSEALKRENRLTPVRVDLGERQVAGAAEEARRRIEALISIAVEAGGVSWQSAGATAILLDGRSRSSSGGLTVRQSRSLDDDSYGIGGTSEILSIVADQFADVLAKEPMPEQFVEALTSLREARMTDHRDVSFYGARRVTPRVATALEDHAMELFASVLNVRASELATSLQRREALRRADSRIAGQLMAPLEEAWSRGPNAGRDELERKISKYSRGGIRLVSVAKAVALQDEIRALPMSELKRADLEDALAICTVPDRERQLLDETWRETGLLRARHRRVRNAVNHGLLLDETTLNSIRNYAECTSKTALDIALTWFKNGESGAALIQREEKTWTARMDRISSGMSCADEDARTEEES
ncbi:hypothetical protein [Arthrobacter crystallopoietes]|uniref:hypothetical protein n=1 Tax=Crystallibacter crystallopoietes TaxID=37928 RepID=UPI001ABE652F|nr:hypothetical protein [Arthrobacter crystallopoietes]QTG82083.1 hypothetical protein J5251_05760 [Arthrobacter crystallopoietes]